MRKISNKIYKIADIIQKIYNSRGMQVLNYHHLYIFMVLANEGGFTKAAKKLAISQSAVTSQIKTLEVQLGVVLVDRTTKHRFALTSEGLSVVEYCRTIFKEGEALLQWTQNRDANRQEVLRVGALSGLSRNLQYEFLKPAIESTAVSLEVTTGDQEKLVRLLCDQAIDVILSSHNVSSKNAKTPFFAHVLCASQVVFVVQRNAGLREGRLNDYLKRGPLYIPGKDFEARPELDAFLDSVKVPFTVSGEVDDIALLRLIALRSGAVVAVPRLGVEEEIKNKEVIVLKSAVQIQQRFYAITRLQRLSNPLLAAMVSRVRGQGKVR